MKTGIHSAPDSSGNFHKPLRISVSTFCMPLLIKVPSNFFPCKYYPVPKRFYRVCRLESFFFFEGINKNWRRAVVVCKRRIGGDKDCLCMREALDEIGYFLLTPLTSRGVHERHYEFIDSREPNELPSPGNSRDRNHLFSMYYFYSGTSSMGYQFFLYLFSLPPPTPHIIFTTGAPFSWQLSHTFNSVFYSLNLFKLLCCPFPK